ncbi:MAG: c-type cytochrome, partial [Bdellovibrionota bacterium]
ATLPPDDRWALAQYVLSLGPPAPADNPQTLARNGVSAAGGGGGGEETPSIPIALAMERMAQAPTSADLKAHLYHSNFEPGAHGEGGAAQVYQNRCASCHGDRGEGGIKIRNLGVNPVAFVTTEAFHGASENLRSAESFGKLVSRGIPGELMPGNGQLSGSEMRDLFGYVKGLAR